MSSSPWEEQMPGLQLWELQHRDTERWRRRTGARHAGRAALPVLWWDLLCPSQPVTPSTYTPLGTREKPGN